MRILLATLLVLLACGGCGPAAAQVLKVELLLTDEDLTVPPATAPVQLRAEAETPDGAVRIPMKRRQAGYWLRLTTDAAIPPGHHQALVLHGAHALGPVTFYPPSATPRVIEEGEQDGSWLLRRGWNLPLPNGWPEATVAYLRVNGQVSQALQLQLADVASVVREERRQARQSSAAFTTLMLTAIFMIGLWIAFRDLLYMSFAAYLVAVAAYSMLLSGDAGEMASLGWISRNGPTARLALGTLAVTLQLVFTLRFLELDRLMPRRAKLMQAMIWLHFGLLAVLLVGREHVVGWYGPVISTLVLSMIPLAVVIAVHAWLKGAAYANYFMAGWMPLLLMATLVACHQLGLLDVPWAERILPLGAVLQSGVLALALTQHAANRHRIALLARQSIERDPLTGALNRRALEQMLAAWNQIGHLGASHYCVLLVDLDDFAAVNQQHGYAVGDTVMQQVLARVRGLIRPDDTVARMESDTFAVVSECHRAECELLAQRLVEGFQRRPFSVDGYEIPVSVSIGVAMSRRGETVETLLKRAEDALSSASMAGHNSVALSSMDPGARRRRRAMAGRAMDAGDAASAARPDESA